MLPVMVQAENVTMTQRHFDQAGHLMLVTTNTVKRKSTFADPANAREAIESLYRIQYWNPFFLFGFVIMPDHCHFLLTVPEPNTISNLMFMYKRAVAFNIGKPIWQKRFHVRIVNDGASALRYIHYNPVEARFCERPQDYRWSSASGRWDVLDLDPWSMSLLSSQRTILGAMGAHEASCAEDKNIGQPPILHAMGFERSVVR